MPIYQRGNSYQAVLNNPALPGGRARVTFGTKAEAEQWLMQGRVAILSGKSPSSVLALASGLPVTMADLLKRVEVDHWQGTKGERTAMINAKQVIDVIGSNVSPADITDQVVRDMIAEFKGAGNSSGTINRKLAALSKMLQHYTEIGGTLRLPKIPKLKEGQHRIRYITEDEEQVMLKWASDMGLDNFHDFVVLGLDTGLRTRTEALALLPSNIMKQSGAPVAITVHPDQAKSKKPRTIPLTQRCKEIIARRSNTLFREFTYSQLRWTWDRMKEDMGLSEDPQFIPYALRHTFCSRLVQRGVHLVTVKELAGHSDVSVTMRYSHLAPHNYTDAIKVLE